MIPDNMAWMYIDGALDSANLIGVKSVSIAIQFTDSDGEKIDSVVVPKVQAPAVHLSDTPIVILNLATDDNAVKVLAMARQKLRDALKRC